MLEEQEKQTETVTALRLPAGAERKQRQQMLIALTLLLVALGWVLYKDWQFWFPAPHARETVTAADLSQSEGPSSQPQPQRLSLPQPPGTPAKPKEHSKGPVPAIPNMPPSIAPIVMNRAVLPPLQVEVVAGDQHRAVQPGNPSVKVELQPRQSATYSVQSVPSPAGGDITTNASEHVRLSADTTQVVSRTVQPSYPMLAKQMKVQGAVVLQALIGKEGTIQDLHVLSGPAILSTAALDAVRQWHFKPYLQEGLPVETEARITVNFTISAY